MSKADHYAQEKLFNAVSCLANRPRAASPAARQRFDPFNALGTDRRGKAQGCGLPLRHDRECGTGQAEGPSRKTKRLINPGKPWDGNP
jgi:hypothetical protein